VGECHVALSTFDVVNAVGLNPLSGSPVFSFLREPEPTQYEETLSNGSWSEWRPQETCTLPCGPERYLAARECSQPLPHPRAKGCDGLTEKFVNCNTCDGEEVIKSNS